MAAGTPGRGRIGCSHANRPLDSYRSHPRNRHRVAVGAAARAKAARAKAAGPAAGAADRRRAETLEGRLRWHGGRRVVRVLAPYSRTFYFNELGRERGYAADLVRVVEADLNKTLAKQLGNRPLTFMLIPTTRDKLISGVADGIGDIAVNLGVSESRQQVVDFLVAPDLPRFRRSSLRGPSRPSSTRSRICGRTVHARASSTYMRALWPSTIGSGRLVSPSSTSSRYPTRSRTKT